MIKNKNNIEIGDLIGVTGANGFIGTHIIRHLLIYGFKVKAYIRNMNKVEHIKLIATEVGQLNNLSFEVCDLCDNSMNLSFDGCKAVINSAAIVSLTSNNPWNEVVDPIMTMTKNVLDAVEKSTTIRRVIHTSSIITVWRYSAHHATLNESDFNDCSTVEDGDPYGYAKRKSEELVINTCKNIGMDYVIVNPGMCLGTAYTAKHVDGSLTYITKLLTKQYQANMFVPFVDVADVARCHVKALLTNNAVGNRFIVVNDDEGCCSVESIRQQIIKLCPEVAEQLKEKTTILTSFQVQLYFKRYIIALLILAFIFLFIDNDFAITLMMASIGVYFITKPTKFTQALLKSKTKYNADKSRDIIGLQYTPFDITLKDSVQSIIPFVR